MKRKNMLKILALTCGLCLGWVGPAFAEFTITVLHINDFHSRIEPVNRFGATCFGEQVSENECFGGIARLKSKIDERRAALANMERPTLLLDAGDQFQGSLFYSSYKGDAAVEFMNQMGFDAMAVGNHEFDDGPKTLRKLIDTARFPVLSGNTSVRDEPALKGRLPGYTIVKKGGEKIGIISVLAEDTSETSSPGENVHFVNAINYLESVIPEIEAEGVNKIIALTHVGLAQDIAIAEATRGIDLIVGGHSHTLLSNSSEDAEGPYPMSARNVDGEEVFIVHAGANSKYLGELRVTFDDLGRIKIASGNPHLIDADVEPDAAFEARVTELAKPFLSLKTEIVGFTKNAIDGSRQRCRTGECAMGNLVAEAMLDRTKAQGVSIAIQNGGGLRTSISAGAITKGELLEVLPFQNTLATFQIKGVDILNALENGVSQVEEQKGRFPQVAGLRFSWDKSMFANKNRIREVQVKEADEWVNLDPEKTYSVVTNDYVRRGGDGYTVFAENAMNAYDFGPLLENVVSDYLEKAGIYAPAIDGRILEGRSFEKPNAPARIAASGVFESETLETAGLVENIAVPTPSPIAKTRVKTKTETPAEPTATVEIAAEVTVDPEIEVPAIVPTAKPQQETEETGIEIATVIPTEKPENLSLLSSEPSEATVPLANKVPEPKPTDAVPEQAPRAGTETESDLESGAVTTPAPFQTEEVPKADKSKIRRYTVQPGDNLWEIARKVYGDATRWRLIQDVNDSAKIRTMKLGSVLKIPPLPAEPEASASAPQETRRPPKPKSGTYTVQRRDTLWIIARKVYGDATLWKRIRDANSVDKIRNMKIGTELTVPR